MSALTPTAAARADIGFVGDAPATNVAQSYRPKSGLAQTAVMDKRAAVPADRIITEGPQSRRREMRITVKRPAGSGPPWENSATGMEPDFSFIPSELAIKCERLIRAYHAAPASPHLADLVWQSGARAIIRKHRALGEILTQSAKTRSPKKTDDLLRIIAKTILAIEVLASNYAGWGTRFPDAMRRAEQILSDVRLGSSGHLMDHYLYQSLDPRRDIARVLDLP